FGDVIGDGDDGTHEQPWGRPAGVGEAGLEPAPLAGQDPKSCVAASYTTRPAGPAAPGLSYGHRRGRPGFGESVPDGGGGLGCRVRGGFAQRTIGAGKWGRNGAFRRASTHPTTSATAWRPMRISISPPPPAPRR